MSKIVWLSSYPKSGNTWVRFIIAHLIGNNVRSSGDVYRLIPDIHKGITSFDLVGRRNIVIKSHLKYFDEMPLREDTVGVVYVVRNPLDVIASAINYLPLRDSVAYSRACDEQRQAARQAVLNDFLEEGGPRRWARMGAGTWLQHVISWHSKEMPFPRLTLKYEDLQTRPSESVAQLCHFLKLESSAEQIETALAASTFESMRAMEEKEISEGQPGLFVAENPKPTFSLGLRFMREGTVGGYRQSLTDAQIDRARQCFGPGMEKFGYD